MQIKCPITDEVLATFGKDGFTRRSNYREVFFVLSDHSRMKIIISKTAMNDLKKEKLDEIFNEIQSKRVNNLKGKSFDKKNKELAIKRLSLLGYNKVVNKKDTLIDKKVLNKKQ